MKQVLKAILILGVVTAAFARTGLAQPAGNRAMQSLVTTAITYQGRLTDLGAPAHGSYDLRFSLYDALEGGARLAGPMIYDDVAVDNGTFTVELDFGEGIFNGPARFLEIEVRRGASAGAFTILTPRQSLSATPYALALPGLRTENLAADAPSVIGGALANMATAGIQGATISGGGTEEQPNQVAAEHGTVSGGLGNMAGAQAATVGGGADNEATGDYATIPGGSGNQASGMYSFAAGHHASASHPGAFVWADSGDAMLQSTVADQFLIRSSGGVTFTTSSGPLLRLIPHSESPNLVAGYGENALTTGVKGGVIGGGGESSSINKVTDHFSVVSGGASNQAGNNAGANSDAPYASVGGGKSNRASGRASTIGGGEYNTATARDATVGGGYQNSATGQDATIAGGRGNTAGGEDATVAGGTANGASALYSSVGGGTLNTAGAQSATVAGGNANQASAANSTVAGGNGNIASDTYASVGGGRLNTASGTHATVAGGHSNTSSGANSAVGGGHDNVASGAEATSPGGGGNRAGGDFSFAAGRQAIASHDGSFVWADSQMADFPSLADNDFNVRATGGVNFVTAIDMFGNPTAGISLPAGGSSWGTPSDRNLKEHITPVDSREILQKLADMPISQWNYRAQDASIQHIGPMAQDFYAAFGLGDDDRYIATVDADGVALASSQALYQLVLNQTAQIAALEARLDALEAAGDPGRSATADLPAWLLLGVTLAAGLTVAPRLIRGGKA
jgi:trimeric autotransporter adhesin